MDRLGVDVEVSAMVGKGVILGNAVGGSVCCEVRAGLAVVVKVSSMVGQGVNVGNAVIVGTKVIVGGKEFVGEAVGPTAMH